MIKYKTARPFVQSIEVKRRLPGVFATAGGVILNLFILSIPLVMSGKLASFINDMPLLMFLFAASMFCLCELSCFVRSDSRPDRLRPNKSHFQAFGLALCVGISILAVYWVAIISRIHASHTSQGIGIFQVIGMVVMATGIGLRIASIRRLGPYFITDIKIKPGQPLVREGIYKRLRHPSELGLLCCIIGGSLILESKLGLAICMVWILPLIILRISMEERLLQRVFGERFEGYVLSSRKLLPLVY